MPEQLRKVFAQAVLIGGWVIWGGGFPSLEKRKHTPPCSSAELFVAEKNGGHRGKISVVDMLSHHRVRSDVPANANAISETPRKFVSEFSPPNLKQKVTNSALRRNALANANGFANELRKFRPRCGIS